MLARYLRTSTRPIRYNMHPELAQALSNYLRIHARANELPHHAAQTLHMAQRLGDADYAQQVARLRPQLHELMQGILGGHHEAPGMYLDLLHENLPEVSRLAGPPLHRQLRLADPVGYLLEHLSQLSGVVQHPEAAAAYRSDSFGMRARGADNLATAGWHGNLPDQMTSPRQSLLDLMRHERTPADLRGYLRAIDRNNRRGNLPTSDPVLRLMTANDLARESISRGPEQSLHGHELYAGTRDVLRDHLIPHLNQLGGA